MFPRILNQMRENIRTRRYVMTLHAEEEMDNDALSIYDVEHAVLTGTIQRRQKDLKTGEWKYIIQGPSFDAERMEVVAKLSPLGKLVIITVYRT